MGNVSAELAGLIPGAERYVYPDLGHGAYEEARDFNRRVLDFLPELAVLCLEAPLPALGHEPLIQRDGQVGLGGVGEPRTAGEL